MQLENYVFEIVDKILNCIAGVIGLLLLLYACYTWWDTQQIYENASATSYSVYNPKNPDDFGSLKRDFLTMKHFLLHPYLHTLNYLSLVSTGN